ncbi:DNA primase family protein [Deinococcus cellulosilyticus]|nr:DNA primase family protein [Deinococcus cellulosilyticus]
MLAERGFIELRLLGEKGSGMLDRLWMEWPSHPSDAPKIPEKWQKHNAYWGVALRTPEGQALNSGTKQYTHPTHLVICDVDLSGSRYLDGEANPHLMPPEVLREASQRAMADTLDILEEHNLPPRAIVYSGHGIQVYLCRRARSTFEDTEAYNHGLCNLLEGDHNSTDQARILRLPGTWNNKNPDRPLPVEVWYTDPGAFVEDRDLEKHAVRQVYTRPAGDSIRNTGTISDLDLKVIGQAWTDLKTQKHQSGYGRHQLSLFFCGWLKQNGYSEGDAYELVRKLATEAGDEELAGRLKNVRTTYRTEGNTKGWEGLTKDLGLELSGIPLASKNSATITKGKTPKPAGRDTEKLTLLDYANCFLEWNMYQGESYAYYEPWGLWFRYEHGVYHQLHEDSMTRMLDMVLQDHGHVDLSGRKLKDILQKIRHTQGVFRTTIDQGPFELNCKNGILDLQTLTLREHTPEYFSIVQTPVEFNPSVGCPAWGQFLREAVPNEEHRSVLQQYFGYCLTDDTRAQKSLWLIGEGGTGKGTAAHVLTALLGGDAKYSLAGASPIEAIQDGTPHLEGLVGKRLCVISEIPKHVNWASFKRVTGEDTVKINPKYRDAYNIQLNLKIMVLSNVLPHLGEDATNTSVVRRLLPVPFDIKAQQANPKLREELTSPGELSGILNWAIRGLHLLQEKNYVFPDLMGQHLMQELIEQSNPLITFLEESCTPGGSIGSTEIYKAYCAWADSNRIRSVSSKRFATDLTAAARHHNWQISKEHTKYGRQWNGLSLKGTVSFI